MLLSTVANVLMGTLTGDCEFNKFVIDSRNVTPGDVFVCLKGERVDGHDYIGQAAENGAVGFLCARPVKTDLPCLIVPSPEQALQEFASWYRRNKKSKIVAVTGSVGKTTTKECIYSALKEKYKTHKTSGNMNSETGLPLTLLGISDDDEMTVAEMGMSGFREIELLSNIAEPDIAVITNIGVSHIEKLGSRENILKAKLEILSGLNNDGALVLNYDDQLLKKAYDDDLNGKISQRIVRYGINNPLCDYYARDVVMDDGCLRFLAITPQIEFTVMMPCEGVHNVYNALAAISVAMETGVSAEEIVRGLKSFIPPAQRQQSYTKDGFNIIEDCYNASPQSVKAAFDVLRRRNGRKVAVLGDMLELGDYSEEYHTEIGKAAEGIDVLIVFGNFRDCVINGALSVGLVQAENCYSCETRSEAADVLKRIAVQGDYILVKASRGMYAEKVIEEFFEQKGI